jgi:Reverse transcriptase (RNA-dependent DNA polymerase).
MWDALITKENFEVAQKDSRRGKSTRRQIVAFEKDLESNLEHVRQSVIDGSFHTSRYRSRAIYEPKKRTIYILPYNPDRIVQHAIANILIPYFKKIFISDSYACIEGRGQMQASLRTMQAVRRNKYCLKCDIHHFYPSIDQKVLSNLYHGKFRDEEFLRVVDDIIFSFPGGKNMPIGNYMSQWSGNFYLTPLDNFCKHELKIRDYIRYCDDFLLFGDDKAYLHDCRKRIEDFIGENLLLEYSKADVFNIKQGVDFCGYRHFDNYILIRKSTAQRQIRKINKLPLMYENGKIDKDGMRSTIDSILGWLKHAKTYNMKNAMKIYGIRRKYVEV